MAAAVRAFYRDGLHATGVAALAAEANVSSRTLYKHFPSKTELIREYLGVAAAAIEASVDAAVNSEADVLKAVSAVFDNVAASVQAMPDGSRGCPMLNAQVEATGDLADIRPLIVEHKRTLLRNFEDLLRRAEHPQPETVALRILITLEGGIAVAATFGGTEPLAEAKEVVRMVVAAADC